MNCLRTYLHLLWLEVKPGYTPTHITPLSHIVSANVTSTNATLYSIAYLTGVMSQVTQLDEITTHPLLALWLVIPGFVCLLSLGEFHSAMLLNSH